MPWSGHRIPSLSQAIWNSICLIEGGSTPLGIEVISQLRGKPSLDFRLQGQQKPNQWWQLRRHCQSNTEWVQTQLRKCNNFKPTLLLSCFCSSPRYYQLSKHLLGNKPFHNTLFPYSFWNVYFSCPWAYTFSLTCPYAQDFSNMSVVRVGLLMDYWRVWLPEWEMKLSMYQIHTSSNRTFNCNCPLRNQAEIHLLFGNFPLNNLY